MRRFPFGQPVGACQPLADGPRPVFVLGAYPSALHVRWRPADGPGTRLVRALAVDNEPEPFWDGADQDARIVGWKAAVGWQDDRGEVAAPVGDLNGSSGRLVDAHVLVPLGAERGDAWITDCLDTYRASTGMRKAVEEVYEPFAAEHELPSASLASHPSEGQIVAEATGQHLGRLRTELATAVPELVVTLGNAALRVFRALLEAPDGPRKLAADDYGIRFAVAVGGRSLVWLPLAHPAAPKPYQVAHSAWMSTAAGT